VALDISVGSSPTAHRRPDQQLDRRSYWAFRASVRQRGPANLDADQGVQLLRLLTPARAVLTHYDDYTVFKSSLDDFTAAVDAAEDLRPEVRYLARGERLQFGCGT
jgi:hypothetical protein